MDNRADHIRAFLESTPWKSWARTPLAGDASRRRYERLTSPDQKSSAILMDAPPEMGEDIRPFIAVAQHLERVGLAPPSLLQWDDAAGFLVLEDLGNEIFARVLEKEPDQEEILYRTAVDALLHLHASEPMHSLPNYSAELMTTLAGNCFDWYCDRPDLKPEFRSLIEPLLETCLKGPNVVALRDYHAENLIWIPGRIEARRVGLLDFQDAMMCHPAYDLMSLLRDARRDVSPTIREEMIYYFIKASDTDPEPFKSACALLGLQRNLRILFIFARLSLGFGKPHYVDLIPRVWQHIVEDLEHPTLAPIRSFLLENLPAPSPAFLQDLKDRCNTRPVL